MPTKPQVNAASRGRARRAAVAVAAVLVVGACATWAALNLREDAPPAGSAITSAPATDPSSPDQPSPSPEAPVDPAVYADVPQATWETSAEELMGSADSGVILAAPDPAGRPDEADVLVLAAWVGDSSAAVGLDRATGAQVWRQDFPGVRQTACYVLGDGRRTACSVPVAEGSADHRVVTLVTSTGEIVGDDTVAQTPRHVVAVGDDLVVAGSNVADGRLMMSRGTPADVDRLWAAESGPGFVDQTEYWGEYTTDEGRAAFEVSGASMSVDLATGDAQLSLTGGEGRLGLWPGGVSTRTTVVNATDSAPAGGTTTLTLADGSVLTVPGSPWAWTGDGDVQTDVVGADDTAFDARTAEVLWTAPERDDALATSYLAAADLVIQASWYEESAQLLALDLRTGAEAWRASTRSYAEATLHGRVLLLGSFWELTAIDLGTGESPWKLAYEGDMAGDEFYWDNTVGHAVLGDALVTVSYGTVRGYSFT